MPDVKKSRILEYVGKVLLLAALNYAFGRLGLVLAVHPGYASPLWPPAGIALGVLLINGGRFWPGVFLASFLLNAGLPEASLSGIDLNEAKIWSALGIAAGSALQAYAGAVLIRKFFSMPVTLSSLHDAARLLALGGPISCVVAATVGVTVLYLAGIVPPEEYLQNWRVWWFGDTLGVIVFLPLTMVCRDVLGHVLTARHPIRLFPATALITLAIPLCVTLVAWNLAVQHAHEKAQSQFHHFALENERALEYRMDSYEQSLLSGVGLFAGSGSVNRQEWKKFAEAIGICKRATGLSGISFIANVAPGDLKDFVRRTRADGAPGFTIHPESKDADFFIIKFRAPEDLSGQILGLNIAYEEKRKAAAFLARDTGKAAISQKILLMKDKNADPGFILMLPFYKQGSPVSTVEERRTALAGWVTAPFLAKDFMSGLTASQGRDFDLAVYDNSAGAADNLIYASGSLNPKAAHIVRKELDIKQQKWTFIWASTKAFEKKEGGNEPFIILLAGMLFTGLLGVLLMMQAHRAETVERMVEMRTAELTEREAHLAQVVDKLTESNVELERFAYVVSHDMQEPVRMVANFSSLLWHQYQDRMDPAGQKYLGIISDGAKRLQAMIADLLDYARVGQDARGREKVDCKVLLQYVLENLNFVIYEHEAKITHGDLPSFQGYPVQMMSLFQNLINNAIKYQSKTARPVVHIAAEDKGDHILFSVRDNGLGIGAEHLDKIFEPFKRLHTYQEISGTGLGLAVCKKIVANHGGRIWVESTPGQGSTFYFTVMK